MSGFAGFSKFQQFGFEMACLLEFLLLGGAFRGLRLLRVRLQVCIFEFTDRHFSLVLSFCPSVCVLCLTRGNQHVTLDSCTVQTALGMKPFRSRVFQNMLARGVRFRFSA